MNTELEISAVKTAASIIRKTRGNDEKASAVLAEKYPTLSEKERQSVINKGYDQIMGGRS